MPKGTKGARSSKRGKGDEDRDENGRYLPGHSIPGPGNPYAQRVAAMRAALLSAVSAQDIKAMAVAMVTAAKAGDAASFRVLGGYLFGRPVNAEDAADEDTPRGSLVVEFTRYIRMDGSEIQHGDSDWPAELEARRARALHGETVVRFDGADANL